MLHERFYTMSKKNSLFNSNTVEVTWANIADPDEYRGTLKHQIQVIADEELTTLLEGHANGAKINGLRQDAEGRSILKAKSSVYTKEGETRFGRVFDSVGKDTDINPYRGDKVRLRLSPFTLNDGSVSFFLNAVQIVEKVEYAGGASSSGFDAVEGGFEAASVPAAPAAPVATQPEVTADDDLPF